MMPGIELFLATPHIGDIATTAVYCAAGWIVLIFVHGFTFYG